MRDRILQVGLATLLVVFASGCLDPKDRRPGLRLSGEVVSDAIDDWSFSDEFQEVYLETQTWYLIPHSVTTVCAGLNEKLYVPTIYYGGGEWPNKYWNSNVVSDPHVRLEMGGKLYEFAAVVVNARVIEFADAVAATASATDPAASPTKALFIECRIRFSPLSKSDSSASCNRRATAVPPPGEPRNFRADAAATEQKRVRYCWPRLSCA